MNGRIALLVVILLAFGALSIEALLDHGYFGIWAFHFTSTAGMQVLSDLVLVCLLASIWMLADARRTGRNAVPYVLLTLVAGSFGPLLYLLVGEFMRRTRAAALG